CPPPSPSGSPSPPFPLSFPTRRSSDLVADWLVALLATIVAAAPAVPVAVNVTGLPESDPDVAVKVLSPAVTLRVQLPTVATPLALERKRTRLISRHRHVSDDVIATCATGFPFAS